LCLISIIIKPSNEEPKHRRRKRKMTEKERFIELEDLLTRECGKYEKDCTTCPYRKECEEYEKLFLAYSEEV
jgi:hypothetical protein